jgi:hypothetical protein
MLELDLADWCYVLIGAISTLPWLDEGAIDSLENSHGLFNR